MSSIDHQPSAADIPATGIRRVLLSCCLGTVIEFYDFFVYAVIAPLVFDKLFFPKFAPLAGTLAVMATFAVGFVARPLGGLLCGHFGDRIGRKPTLFITLMVMGLSTAGVGFLPSYQQIGIWAPVLLVSLRFVQGLALGGETTGALLLMLECAPATRRGLLCSLVVVTGPLGMIVAELATHAVTRLPEADLLSWGWRVPFLISLALVVIGAYVRMKVEESPIFLKAASRAVKVPLLEVLTKYRKPTLIVFFAALIEASFFYFIEVFSLSYGVKSLHMHKEDVVQALLAANCVALVAIPFCGWLSDRVGRRPLFAAGALLAGLFVLFVYFGLMDTRAPMYVTLAVVIGILIQATIFGTEGAYYSELFDDARVRFSGVALGKQMSAIVSGLTPLISTQLLMGPGKTTSVALYMAGLGVLSLVAVLMAPETRGKTL